MGGAFVAVAEGAEALWFNPAGLAYLSAPEVGSLYEFRFGASSLLRAAGAVPRWGGGMALFSFGPVEGRDAQGEVTESLGYLQLGLVGAGGWTPADLPVAAFRDAQGWAFGVRAKLIGVSTAEASGGGAALDGGILLRWQRPFAQAIEELRLGAAVENLPGVGASGPPRGTIGLAVRPMAELTLAVDLAFPWAVHAGGEMQIPLPGEVLPSPGRGGAVVAVRVGGFWEGDLWALTAGFGLRVGSFQWDYAIQSHPQLPGIHRIGIAWRF